MAPSTQMAMSDHADVRGDYHGLVRTDVFPLIPRNGGTLLDFGGGVGATAARLKELGYVECAGTVDLVAKEADQSRLDFVCAGNVEDPTFLQDVAREYGPFDTILCLDILEHLRNPWQIVAELHAMLAENGIIIASIPNVRNYKASLPLFFLNRWDLADAGILDRTHLRFFVKSTAIDLMTSSGLKLEEVRAIPSGGRKIRLIRAVTLGLFDSFTDRQYVIRVRKP